MRRKKRRAPLSREARVVCVTIVRNYPNRRKNYEKARRELLYGCSEERGLAHPVGGHADPTATRALRLQQLEESPETRLMYAVERALEEQEPGIRDLLLQNIIEKIPYEHLPFPCCRDTFFERKNEFLSAVAENLGLWRLREDD